MVGTASLTLRRRPLSLAQCLARQDSPLEPLVLELLRLPWFRPVRPGLVGRTASEAPRSLVPGEVLLAAWDGDHRGALFRASPVGTDEIALPWGAEARRTLLLADRIVRLAAPMLGVAPTTERLRLNGFRIPALHDAEQLEGRSFGASMVLALASQMLRRPLPSDFAASAAIRPDGALEPVERIDEKLTAICDYALGVTRFFIAPAQEISTRAQRRATSAGVLIHRVGDVDGLMEAVLPEAFGGDALTPSALDARARELYRFALSRRALLSWKKVEAAATRVRDALPRDAAARGLAEFAALVAARHQGRSKSITPPADEVLRAMPRPTRLKHIAHVVQSHTDAGDPALNEVASWAREWLPELRECSEEELEVRGAIGRALSVLGRHAEGIAFLEDTVAHWIEIEHAHEASLALCELVRLLGITGDRARLDTMRHSFIPAVLDDARTDLDSEAFVRLALGRASVQVGDIMRGLELLDRGPFDWDLLRDDVRMSRLRWLVRAHRANGSARAVHDALADLRRIAAGEPKPLELVLAELDAALAVGTSASDVVEAIRKDNPGLCSHLWRDRPESDRARILAEEFPY